MGSQKITVQLDDDIVEKAKNIVYWEPSLTLTSFLQRAIEKQIEIYEEIHGANIPVRPNKNLQSGRPIQ